MQIFVFTLLTSAKLCIIIVQKVQSILCNKKQRCVMGIKRYDFSYSAFKAIYESNEKKAKEKQAKNDCSACLNVGCLKWVENLPRKN